MGASIVDAFKVGSYNPAKAVGFTDRGEIAVGKRADLVVVDHKMNVKQVFLKGEISNFKAHSRGHFYFTLKDEEARINAIILIIIGARLATPTIKNTIDNNVGTSFISLLL